MDKIDPVTEKPLVQATVTPVAADDDLGSLESDTSRPGRDLRQAIYTIVGGVALPCIPIIVITAVLLYFIFKHRIVPVAGWPELYEAQKGVAIRNVTDFIHEIRHEGGKPAYYVKYNPSTITTIASWTGRVIPYLSSSIMALVAFFAARHLVLKSKHGHHTELPTPEQLTILIGLLGGSGFGPLRDTVLYRWGRKQRLVAPLPAAFAALAIITALGIIIPVVDTWFGVATSPATITQLYNTTAQAYHSFGRHLDISADMYPTCQAGPGNDAGTAQNDQLFWWPCNIFMPLDHAADMYLQGGQAASDVQLNLPTDNTVWNYTGPASSGNGPNHTFFFYGDQRSSATLDFKARTMGMVTQCEIATTKCYDSSNGTAFSCPGGGFAGDFSECLPGVWPADDESGGCTTGIGFSPDARLSRDAGFVNITDGGYNQSEITVLLRQNPTYFGAWGYGYPAAGDSNNKLWQGPQQWDEVFYEGATTATWLLNCSATVYDVSYTYVAGQLHTFNATPAAPEWGAFYSAPFSWAWLPSMQPSKMALEDAAYYSTYTAETPTQLANIWAQEYSKAALAMSVGVFAPRVNEIEQVRNSTISVARVPLIPLYLLLGFKFLYVVTVIVLAIGAYCFTHPAETEIVKAQLSVKGLAAAHFDQPDLLRENVVKEVQSRLNLAKTGTDGVGGAGIGVSGDGGQDSERAPSSSHSPPVGEPSRRAVTEPGAVPAGPADDHPPKIGLMPTRTGAWQFVLLANGAWQSVKPMVQSFVLAEAQTGKLGATGDVYAAWK